MPELKLKLNPDTPANLQAIFWGCIKSLSGTHQRLTFVLPGHKPARQSHRHLAGAKSPKGEIVSDVEDGQLVSFSSLDVLAWMTANGFCSAE